MDSATTGFTTAGHQSSALPVTDTTLSLDPAGFATSPTITVRTLLPECVTRTGPCLMTAVRADFCPASSRKTFATTVTPPIVRSRCCSLPVTGNAMTVDLRRRRRLNVAQCPEKLTTTKAPVISCPGSVRRDIWSTVAATHTGLFAMLV